MADDDKDVYQVDEAYGPIPDEQELLILDAVHVLIGMMDNLPASFMVRACGVTLAFLARRFETDPLDVLDDVRKSLLYYFDRTEGVTWSKKP